MSDAFIGEIRLVPFIKTQPPRGWLICDGSLVKIGQYGMLFSLLSTSYGGDGVTTFGLPDLRGRVLVGQGAGPGLTLRTMGQKGGSEQVVLTQAQIPAHTHAFQATTQPNTSKTPGGLYYGSDSSDTYKRYISPVPTDPAPKIQQFSQTTIEPTGGNMPHPNLMAGLGLRYIICAVGDVYPQRS
ncbi:tail fiber protein [Niveispirillum sp. BGYR6]|uniref:phage tail protein n=1 Tax=Niveispirillum sp. BGYR6 TaxID=2971249 RepID=UPI0022B9C728|nr:tail fiber protein [Niveispirillum sp. BGYR6]MDG5497364.1 tail fiber protein [Niveispirillum sp. BGYR6]